MDRALSRLNSLTPQEAADELQKCCGSTRWAGRVSALRPFRDVPELLATADRIWGELSREDWLEAFRSHPKIGEQKASPNVSGDAQCWSEREQAAARAAAPETLATLAAANRVYEDKFGYIFIVCATGKTAGEMLTLLEARLDNDPDSELRIATEEQRRITQLRLQKLLNE
ncbi:MAG: 2-oxo-4-hydroxy-4-carboxy-5-ureidoimidazoline decarboxylase [Acidobacteriota bacterium]|nr:2-oxo-4-hydroxy-4-carboxy-5-ureidoimidazoline decarboxylase [Acidobacteriota bacterium]